MTVIIKNVNLIKEINISCLDFSVWTRVHCLLHAPEQLRFAGADHRHQFSSQVSASRTWASQFQSSCSCCSCSRSISVLTWRSSLSRSFVGGRRFESGGRRRRRSNQKRYDFEPESVRKRKLFWKWFLKCDKLFVCCNSRFCIHLSSLLISGKMYWHYYGRTGFMQKA